MTDQTRPPTDHDDDVTSRRIPRPAPNARAETRPMGEGQDEDEHGRGVGTGGGWGGAATGSITEGSTTTGPNIANNSGGSENPDLSPPGVGTTDTDEDDGTTMGGE